MEARMKYSLNPLAACFVPLSVKSHTGNINRNVHSIKFGKSIPFNTLKRGAPSANKTKATDHSKVKNLDLICKQATFEDRCFTSKKDEVNKSVNATSTPEKLISDEASIDRSEDRTSIEKVDLMEQKDMTGNFSMELERTSNMAYENTDPFETERTSNMAYENKDPLENKRTSDMDDNTDSIKMKWTSNISHENTDSETVQVGNLDSILERGKNQADYENTKPGQHESISSTESVISTKSYQSDYGTDVENMDKEDSISVGKSLQTNFKIHESGGSGKELNLQMKSRNTLSLYLTVLLSSILPSKNSKAKTCSKEILKAGAIFKEECVCPPMFGWIIPFEYFGNPLNLTETCKKNYVHTTYENAIYDTSGVPTVYRKSLDFENQSIDSGHYSDEDESLSSVDEVDTLEQCSSELESIIKDVFDCVDKSLSLCEDEKPQTGDNKNSEVWITANETEVFKVKDSTVIDDGYHPLLQETTSKDDVNIGISIIENLLGEALTFGDKHIKERHSSESSCIPPCSVWCTNVPPSVIDTYKRFVKKIDSEPVSCNVAGEKKVFRKPVYKRCFSANDVPKGFDHEVLSLASSWEPKARFYQKDIAAFKDSRDTVNSNDNLSSKFSSDGQPTNPLKEGSDTWSLYDGTDSLWQPLPDCVLSNDSQKNEYKRARIMRRQKSVG